MLIKYCDVWLIDEMSMIEDQLFDAVELNMRRNACLHEKPKLFAGKDVILFGDPAQLPSRGMPFFCGDLFQYFKVFTLKTIVRQENIEFTRILQQIRLGLTPEPVCKALRSRLIPNIDYDEVIKQHITVIVSLRKDCDRINQECLRRLPGKEFVYVAQDTSNAGGPLTEEQQKRLEAKPEKFKTEIRIKVNALVVLRRNMNTAAGQVNGRLALVESIHDNMVILRSLDGKDSWAVKPLKQIIEDYGQEAYSRSQYPLDLGWAATVHRVQGMTMDRVIVSLDEHFFESGQAYVALTRTRTIEGLQLLKFEPKKVILDPFYRQLLTWIDNNDHFNPNPDRAYPFPVWKGPQSKKQQTSHEPESGDEKEDQQYQSPYKRQPSFKNIIPSPKFQKTKRDEPMDVDSYEETYADKCERLLNQMIDRRLYTKDCKLLEEFLEEHREFCDQILNAIQFQAPIENTDELRSEFTEIIQPGPPVPEEMWENFHLQNNSGLGDCFYHAISVALYGTPALMPLFRFATIIAIVRHRVYFERFCASNSANFLKNLLSVGTFGPREHITRMAYGMSFYDGKNKIVLDEGFSYAHECAQLALSVAILRPIDIYYDGGPNTRATPREDMRPLTPISLQLAHSHFQTLVPRTVEPIRVIPTFYISISIYNEQTHRNDIDEWPLDHEQ
jgi:hypothetical protein